jgi:hypothetical protein
VRAKSLATKGDLDVKLLFYRIHSDGYLSTTGARAGKGTQYLMGAMADEGSHVDQRSNEIAEIV